MEKHHRKNFEILAAGLRTVDETQFDMRVYCDSEDGLLEPRDVLNHCKTSACALGWAPTFLGETGYNDWVDYGDAMFGVTPFGRDDGPCRVYDFIFSSAWETSTPTEVADRIDWMLENGVPDDFPIDRES